MPWSVGDPSGSPSHTSYLARERRMELVDGCGQQRFLTSRRPVHRVQCHAAEDPRRVVTHELCVGQWPDDEARGVQLVEQREESAVQLVDDVLVRDSANQQLGQAIRGQCRQPVPDVVSESRSHQVIGELIQHPVAGIGFRDHVGEQVLQFQDLDATIDHLGDEVEVIAASLLQPDHVVE